MIEAQSMMCTARRLTQGPAFHWFGYYDKLQFDPTGRFVLCMETNFEDRQPTPEDKIRIGMIDLHDGDRWIPLGETTAWCWQQGCMLQWMPGSADKVIYNDRQNGGFCSRILNVKTGTRRTIPHPIYTLSPDGRSAVSLDFTRTGRCRRGYGYAGDDPTLGQNAPNDRGLYRVDLQTGEAELIISLAQVAAIPCSIRDLSNAEQWFNHLLFRPSGRRFIFLHRCRADTGGTFTRMFTANLDGSDLRLLHDGGYFSHFIWQDNDRILAWARRSESESKHFYLINERDGSAEVVGPDEMTVDGHCTYLPGGEWIVNDSCSQNDAARMLHLYLYHLGMSARVELGMFSSPPEYGGEFRCDLHPRHSRDGRYLTIDSTHEGIGRQLYLFDIRQLITKQTTAAQSGTYNSCGANAKADNRNTQRPAFPAMEKR